MEEVVRLITINKKVRLNTIVNLPSGYQNNGEKRYPLILFLHGSGERGNKVENIKKYGIHRYIGKRDIPAIIISPQCAANSFWDKYIDDLETLIAEMTKEYKVDENRIYLIGISLGAFAAWNFGMQKPDLFAAIVPIAGGAMLPQFSYRMKNTPVYAFHGAKDNVVLVEESIKAVSALREAGGNVELTIVEDAGHELCTTVFGRDELYEWLFQKAKTK